MFTVREQRVTDGLLLSPFHSVWASVYRVGPPPTHIEDVSSGLSNGSPFAALFCPVNESVWEHLKLIFFPILFVSIAEYLRYRPEAVRFFYYRFLASLCAMAATVTLFYTYTGITGNNFLVMDILIFIISILFGFYMDAFFYRKSLRKKSQTTTFSLWVAVSLSYFVFTCFPPDIPLFFSMP